MIKKYRIKKLKTIPEEFWQNRDWYSKKFSWYLHTMFPQAVAAVYLINKNFPFSYKWGGSFFGKNGDWFWNENELKRVRKIILKKSSQSREYVDWIAKNFYKGWHNFEKITKKSEGVDLKELSNKELNDWYENLFWAEVNAASWGYIADCFLTSGSEDWLSNLIVEELQNKMAPKKILKAIEILTSPIYNTFINEEKISLLKIGVLADKEKALRKHRDNYHWIENNYAEVYDFPVKYFAEKIIELDKDKIDFKKELQIEEKRVEKNRKAKEGLFKKYKVSKKLRNIIYNADVFTHVQDIRKQGVLRLNHFLFKFIEELARRMKITKKEALYITGQEIKDGLLKGKINRKELRARIKKCFIFISPKGYKILSGKEAEDIDMRVFYRDLGSINKVKGVVASPGKVQGKARVLKNNLEISKFKKDEILVTNNTTPEFVPAMKKAGAIITEQGGITTHAAIVSRELGVPCIIGVKDATRILKTGYIIEVDADKGLVKIVKK